MSDYQVVVTGNLRGDVSREEALIALQKHFGLQEPAAQTLLNGKPKIVKKNLDEKTALLYRQKFLAVGVSCEVRQESLLPSSQTPPAAPVAAPAAAPAPPPEVAPHNEGTSAGVSRSASSHPGFSYQIEGRPDYSFLTVSLPAGETLKVEAAAMATMDVTIRMKTKMKGGLGRLLTGESLFINEFTAEGGPGEIGIAPGPPGDLIHYYLNNGTIFLQNSAFVAAAMGVNLETKWQGLTKGFFSGENLFLIRCTGTGDLWFNTYGAMFAIDVAGDYVVDTGHIVAFTEGLDYQVTKVGGYKSLFFSGEGFVCRFSGTGKVWIQTRMANAFISWAHPFRPMKKSN